MAMVVRNVQALQQRHLQWRDAGAKYSWDNASFHTRAHLPFSSAERIVIPPRSPDIHRVAEHPFHAVKAVIFVVNASL